MIKAHAYIYSNVFLMSIQISLIKLMLTQSHFVVNQKELKLLYVDDLISITCIIKKNPAVRHFVINCFWITMWTKKNEKK